MHIDIVSIFPEYFRPLDLSLIGKARARGLVDVHLWNLRDFTTDVHRTVDDTPYGGGPGMVMRPEPWGEALDAVRAEAETLGAPGPLVVVPTPAGARFTQEIARRYAAEPWLAFVCGRYEGIDDRVVQDAARWGRVEEISIGDYVLAGGEAATLVIIEAVTRLLPGVIGNEASLAEESHADGLLEAPVYTKPAVWRGLAVPEVLLSGNHQAIARWRRAEAIRRTAIRRPDLLALVEEELTAEERRIAAEALREGGSGTDGTRGA
ncbi:MAG: tRNA (guanosine(37)-N1)-methyltransferase TrmD [Acidothermus sp.]|nr:tRNA (guanosine(37)-N1)-methyltransferase TrmD [Acidothermus sp.]MCL6538780.1 tRNA (guanosine(37)-N1)-methyltransferase TrmD [Acidothermus sp.]